MTYSQVRECIILAQSNFQLTTDETFKRAAISSLDHLWMLELELSKGGAPGDLPWNRFLTENIIRSLQSGPPLLLSDIQFLTMVPRILFFFVLAQTHSLRY